MRTIDDVAALHGVAASSILGVNNLLHELGMPVPVMPTAILFGAKATSDASDFLLLLAAMVASTLLGKLAWFAAGRRFGVSALKLFCRFSLSAESCVFQAERVFARWGPFALLVGHFFPGVPLIASPLAGATGMSWGRFVLLTAVGGAVYGLVLLIVGFLARRQIELALHELHSLGWPLFAIAAAVLAAYVGWRWWRWSRVSNRGQAPLAPRGGRLGPRH